ncbi:ABC transporter ATP-binding protein [Cumulibacter manganitolerans]|uniref:ABC transporter ATP-binding protein n=1 Tax=Cumulibacter manganitolerans TaxID=1884992 RepID=UPI0012948B66|nr:ABC transporter ATP-binding protein [Cumulibacter manganitolerans]
MSELVVENLSVCFGRLRAVDGVDLGVRGPEIVAVIGPSGCGKSSLLRAVAGLEVLASGRVLFDGVDQAAVPVHKRRFGLMFQDGQLFEHLSVADNVAYGPRRHGAGRASAAATARRLLGMVGLADYGDRAPATLSGGQRQRVALARALAPRPGLLLLDEPLSALDASLRTRLAADLRTALRETSTMGLLVTHDHEEAFAVADRVVLMRDGRFVQDGTPRQVWSHPVDEDAALFLGYVRVLRGAQLRPLREAFAVTAAALAMRPGALRLSGAEGRPPEGRLAATVLASTPTVDDQRIVVRLADGQELDAVAPIEALLQPGDPVTLELDRGAVAPLPT